MKKFLIVLPIIFLVAASCNQSPIGTGNIGNQSGSNLEKKNDNQPKKDDRSKDGRSVVACTMDAKICPDGSSVGRVPPSCQFAPCPQDVGKQKIAFIEGSLSFPSEYIPNDMKVCAEEISTRKLYCTDKHLKDKKYSNSIGYKLEVPGGGSYYIYATTSAMRNYKSYYSEFVVCGLKVSCPSHQPIGIKINPGQTMTGIDPGDWYNNP